MSQINVAVLIAGCSLARLDLNRLAGEITSRKDEDTTLIYLYEYDPQDKNASPHALIAHSLSVITGDQPVFSFVLNPPNGNIAQQLLRAVDRIVENNEMDTQKPLMIVGVMNHQTINPHSSTLAREMGLGSTCPPILTGEILVLDINTPGKKIDRRHFHVKDWGKE